MTSLEKKEGKTKKAWIVSPELSPPTSSTQEVGNSLELRLSSPVDPLQYGSGAYDTQESADETRTLMGTEQGKKQIKEANNNYFSMRTEAREDTPLFPFERLKIFQK